MSLVIELDQDDGAVNAVIEDGLVIRTAYPCEVGVVKMLFDLGHANGSMPLIHIANVQFDQIEQIDPLLIIEVRSGNALRVKHQVVLPGAGNHVITDFLRGNDCSSTLFLIERLQKCQAFFLFVLPSLVMMTVFIADTSGAD